MASSSSTSELSDEVMWEELPDELLLKVLGYVMVEYGEKKWYGAVRRVSRRWRAVHDGVCQSLSVDDGVTDVGVRELRGLTALTELYLEGCTHVTDVGILHLSSLTKLTNLYLGGTSTTQAGRDALKAALPALKVYGGQ